VVGRHDAANNLLKISVNDVTDSVAHTFGSFANVGAVHYMGNAWDGLIDESFFFKRFLSDAEVTDLFNAGAGRSYSYITGGGGATSASLFELPQPPSRIWVPQSY
jgi:hypothetical protein